MRLDVLKRVVLAAWLLAPAAWLHAGPPTVELHDGLLTIHCADAPLLGLLEQVKAATGMTLIVEGPAASTRLTAQVDGLPVSQAIPRLLEGTGIDYALVADPRDLRRVATLYVGAGKGAAPAGAGSGPAAPPRPAMPEPPPMAEAPAPEEPQGVEDAGLMPEPETDVAETEAALDRAGRARNRPGRDLSLRRPRPNRKQQ
jgi:hypothetical protein